MGKRTHTPAERLAAFLVWKKWTNKEAAAHFGCSEAFVSMLKNGVKLPERMIANAIERVTEASEWSGGTIRSEEWDAMELARRTGAVG